LRPRSIRLPCLYQLQSCSSCKHEGASATVDEVC
jgi:hypothetical protein